VYILYINDFFPEYRKIFQKMEWILIILIINLLIINYYKVWHGIGIYFIEQRHQITDFECGLYDLLKYEAIFLLFFFADQNGAV
jgi:hypothetical protein